MVCVKCGKREATEQILTIHDTVAVGGSPALHAATSAHIYEDWCHKCAEKLRRKAASRWEFKYVQQQRAAGVPFEIIQKELARKIEERWRKPWWLALAFWRW
jgi:hypothetical protein